MTKKQLEKENKELKDKIWWLELRILQLTTPFPQPHKPEEHEGKDVWVHTDPILPVTVVGNALSEEAEEMLKQGLLDVREGRVRRITLEEMEEWDEKEYTRTNRSG